MILQRDVAFDLLQKYVQADHLLKHAIAVEVSMRAYAEHFGENVEYWGQVGLLHDVDYQLYPEEHMQHTGEILLKEGFDEQFVTDIISHNRQWPNERTLLQKTLLAVDEITGFIIACVLVRPDKNIDNLQVKSVMKKFKDKAFARAVNRETILSAAQDLGVELTWHIEFVTRALAQSQNEQRYKGVNLFS